MKLNFFKEELVDAEQTVAFGGRLSAACEQPVCIYLHGDLGAGKTTLARGFIQGLGHIGNVKSPTYTLVEPYELADWQVYHFDLYRLGDPEELEFMGIRDYFSATSHCLVEWSERGEGVLPPPDIDLTLRYVDQQRIIELQANTEVGQRVLNKL
ncbi:tRNA (adenosine(37)-N6)-threonylcarbamoyltransferase complex ATPase subunit type 1 TsaE [Psychromonas sp. MB-3u-54]|uniref:tRNA (adenosine(37)-N6)-threonylcarbamoyltransferase complex ATPase subunit type 1 TsaE n=1 Tax=Psychromonas sp. MB-3u-54 TaxID=2058319 RepID=UPI000C331296|nr:tRNA (adenosine(37)-N6)-threonylcarbamoyltransferase complex ATPase subunit type 1 TsaE [Psychromonas sp. MB-3u-54]PKH02309.1 tRNA (adenosine(37)-N6)-threonylcarbamoyltransferase complex ATPase subunit type 1 TsaE [Psychromonas sp. MB-3u-54]